MIKDLFKEKIGKSQLIEEKEFGKLMQYYAAKDVTDLNFETLLNVEALSLIHSSQKDWSAIKVLNFKILDLLKVMSNQIVSVRLGDKDHGPLWLVSNIIMAFTGSNQIHIPRKKE